MLLLCMQIVPTCLLSLTSFHSYVAVIHEALMLDAVNTYVRNVLFSVCACAFCMHFFTVCVCVCCVCVCVCVCVHVC